MNVPHLLDRTRLARLESLKDAEYAALRKVGDKINDLRHSRKASWDRFHQVTALQPRAMEEAADKAAQLAKLQREIAVISTEISQAEGQRAELSERAQAANEVFESCTKYLGALV